MYQECRKGSGGPPAPGGHMGCRGCALAYMGQGTSSKRPMRQEIRKRESPKGERHLRGALGGRTPPWPHPSLKEGARLRPPSPLALYIVGGMEGSNI